ncbi:hypothetical protein DMH02_005130 [Streptomyces sp. WAC 00631]|uniref:hypothetical protein n=1 Tax=Streptomyces sp. WAC 00631 TaxID=2203201 RepID=UPI000F766C60|nr:hypothetical protein [Streptomyces sp. WAC 00631]MCC5032642.1 hypothetical protein [Streptomyces sp. WAC 00631]
MSHGDGGYRGDHPGDGPGGHQTRTRLPDEPGTGTYGGGRRSSRSPRGLVGVVGVVVLLIAAIAFANRGDGGGESPGKDGKGGPAARATDPTGERPVTGSEAGIATGFPRTEQGAESAAANYVVALSGDGMFDAETRRDIVETVYSPRVASERRTELDRAYSREKFLAGIGLESDGSAPEGMTFVARANPVGTKVEKFGNDSATVAVWYSQLFGLAGEGSKNPVTEGWYTNTLELQWLDNDWKVADFQEKDGPTPVGRDQVASSAEEMAEAVEGFGGFTYAR